MSATPSQPGKPGVGRAIVDAVDRLVLLGLDAEDALEVVGDLVDAVRSAERAPERPQSAPESYEGHYPHHVLPGLGGPFWWGSWSSRPLE